MMNNKTKKILVLSTIITSIFLYARENIELSVGSKGDKEINVSVYDKNDEILLVNKNFGLDKKYTPSNLEIPNIPFSNSAEDEEKMVAEVMVKPLEDLVKAAKSENIILIGNSGYRSYELQKRIYKESLKSYGKEHTEAYVAKAGFSEHQTGLAIDITNEHRYFVKGTAEADWLAKNAYKFGFIIRYQENKTEITGIAYEPWHIRYVGKEAATYIHSNSITLEEYLREQ